MRKDKKSLLLKSIFYDAVGMASTAVPLVGWAVDLVWAPYAARQMSNMYPGKKGKLASVLVFLEEILPFTDVIPTFTLMWIYTFVWKREEAAYGQIIEVESI
jgi:hypothetical protein